MDNQKLNRKSTLQIRFSFSLVQSLIHYQYPSFQINVFLFTKKGSKWACGCYCQSNFGARDIKTFKTKEKIKRGFVVEKDLLALNRFQHLPRLRF